MASSPQSRGGGRGEEHEEERRRRSVLWLQISVLSDPPVPRRSPQNVILLLLERTETLKSLTDSQSHTGEHTFKDYPETTFNY